MAASLPLALGLVGAMMERALDSGPVLRLDSGPLLRVVLINRYGGAIVVAPAAGYVYVRAAHQQIEVMRATRGIPQRTGTPVWHTLCRIGHSAYHRERAILK